eukprot:2304625-Amphidinium_carterae.1
MGLFIFCASSTSRSSSHARIDLSTQRFTVSNKQGKAKLTPSEVLRCIVSKSDHMPVIAC